MLLVKGLCICCISATFSTISLAVPCPFMGQYLGLAVNQSRAYQCQQLRNGVVAAITPSKGQLRGMVQASGCNAPEFSIANEFVNFLSDIRTAHIRRVALSGHIHPHHTRVMVSHFFGCPL